MHFIGEGRGLHKKVSVYTSVEAVYSFFFLICEKLLLIFNETNDAVIIRVESHLSDLLMR